MDDSCSSKSATLTVLGLKFQKTKKKKNSKSYKTVKMLSFSRMSTIDFT